MKSRQSRMVSMATPNHTFNALTFVHQNPQSPDFGDHFINSDNIFFW